MKDRDIQKEVSPTDIKVVEFETEPIEQQVVQPKIVEKKKTVEVPEGYYMGTNGVLYPIGTPQYGIATHIAPNSTMSAEAKARKEKNAKNTGAFVTSLVCSLISVGFTIFTFLWVFDTLKGLDETGGAAGILTLLIFLIGPGWISFLPAAALSSVGLGFGIKAVHSTSKGIKAFSIINIIISSLVLLALFIVLSLLMMGPWIA